MGCVTVIVSGSTSTSVQLAATDPGVSSFVVRVRSRHTGASLTPLTVTATFAAAERASPSSARYVKSPLVVSCSPLSRPSKSPSGSKRSCPARTLEAPCAGCVTVYVSGSTSTSVQSGAVESAGPSSETVTATFAHTGASFTPVIVTATFAVFELVVPSLAW